MRGQDNPNWKGGLLSKVCAGCDDNLITLCSSCNTRANYNRPHWQKAYSEIMAAKQRSKKSGGGWEYEVFGAHS